MFSALIHMIFLLFLQIFYVYCENSITFLQNYGYLESNKNNEFNLLHSEVYRRALLKMQHFANLPLTGILDKATIDKMHQPRCGVVDVDSDSSYHDSNNNNIHNHNKTFINRRRIKRFRTYDTKWDKNVLTWSLVKESSKVPTSMVRAELHNAFQVWADGSEGKLTFHELENDRKADIKIGFFVGDHGCGKKQAFDGPSKKLAHAFSPPKGDIHFDDDEDWNGSKDQGVSLYWTAIHEIGHSLGFAHSADERSIMFPYYHYREGRFKLADIDRMGIRFLYGNDILPNTEPSRTESPIDNSGYQNDTQNEIPQKAKEPCNTNIDAISSIRGDIFVFKNDYFWWIKTNLEIIRPEPSLISSYFIGFPEDIKKIDAVYERRIDQKIVFFVGSNFYIFDANTFYQGPRPISDYGLKDLYGRNINKIDAVFNWGHSGQSFIIARDSYNQESLYWKLNHNEDHADLTYPRRVSTLWINVPTPIDSAFTWSYDSGTYFFKGKEFWKFDNDKMKTTRGYPKFIQNFWFRQIDCPKISQDLIGYSSKCQYLNINLIFIIFVIFFQNFII